LQAGRDVNLLAAETHSGNSEHGKKKTIINETVRQQGTEIVSGGSTTVNSGRDVNSEAAQVTASKDIAVNAGRDITLTTVTDSDYAYKEETKTKKGFLSKKTTHTIKEDSATRENGTLLSGDNVSLNAGNNLLVQGSQVVGDDKVTLKAGNNVDIVAATNTDSSWRFSETKKSGLMGTGGLGISIGSSKSLHDLKEKGTTQSQSVSTVGSTGGDVSITSGGKTLINGGDLIAGKNLSITGDSVVVTPGHDKIIRDEKFEQKSSGLTLALSGAVGEAINSAVATAQATKQESDGRLAALQATKTALSGAQAVLAQQQAQVSGDPNNGVGISISLTTQQSKSGQRQETDTINPSTLNAGNNLSVTATGKGSSDNSGNVVVSASQLKAGGNTILNAANDILLTGAANTQKTTGSNSSSGGGVGISFGVGSGSAGLSVFANVNAANGKEKGNGTTWTETTVDSGGTVALNSGRDTTLSGALVNGEKVTADIGRDLTITSLQDSDNYDSKQTSFGAGGSFTFGTMTGSGYVNVSQDKMHSNYDSVTDQSGIYAGKGGFDITVGNHTQLDGAVIASQADAADNRLDTGTLGFTDIHNEAGYKTEHAGIGVSSGASMGGQFAGNMANTLLAGAGGSGHAEGTTQAAVAEGAIVIRDGAHQQQDVNDLSRDTEHANDSISPIFNKEKEQKRLQTAQLIGEIGSQAADIARTQGDINGLERARADHPEIEKPGPGATQKQRDDYTAELRNTASYKAEMAPFGTGSALQRAIQAATAAVQGLAGGNMAQAISGAAAPYLAEQIHKLTTTKGPDGKDVVNTQANLMAHAVLGAVVAQASGNSALAGAAGATTGEFIAQQLYPGTDRKDLTEEQRQTISALSTLAAGLAGGVAGDSTASAVAGAQAGKNAVENNSLGDIAQAQAEGKTLEQKAGEQVEAENERYRKANCGGMSAEACSVKMYTERREALKDTASLGADFLPVVGTLKSAAEAQSALDYLMAAASLIPGERVAASIFKAAEKALVKGDVVEASKLINKASDEVSGYLPKAGHISLPNSGNGSNAAFSINNAQLGKKLGKHVEDFGGSASNAADRQRVLEVIKDIGNNPDKVIAGKFAGQGVGSGASRGDVFFRIKGNDVVVTKPDGSFITILKNGVNNTSVKNALKGDPK
jgi:filamentous hemagglutinin